MSPSFIIIFPNHLISRAGPGPTDLSSCSSLVLLDGQQTLEEASPACWPGAERDGSINQHRSGCWQEIRRLCPGSSSEENGHGLRRCVRKGTEHEGIHLGAATTVCSMQGHSDWNTLSVLMKHAAPCVLCQCRRLTNGLTWTACLLQMNEVVTVNGGQSVSLLWEGKPTRTETQRPHSYSLLKSPSPNYSSDTELLTCHTPSVCFQTTVLH